MKDMKKTKVIWQILLHSFVDIITNSSTEVYTTCHEKSVDMVKELINSVLKSADSEKTVDDLLEIRVYQDVWREDEEGNENEVRIYNEEVDFQDECSPVYLEVKLIEENKDISNLIEKVFIAQEFCA
jgi:hypothetical protein